MKSLALLALVIASAVGHSYVSQPASRTNQGQSQTGCRGPTCVGPCDGTQVAVRGTVARGQTLNIRWPRNNHPGGFIRFAWAPHADSNNHAAFDARVSQIFCHERGTVAGQNCAPGSAGDPNGGDSKSSGNPGEHCEANVVVPGWLTDGGWTLQWAWFGGGFALGDYYSCVDYIVSGGNTATQGAPSFTGGDYANPGGQMCKTFNTDALHRCTNEPCNNPVFNGQRNSLPAGVTGGGPAPNPPPNPPTPTPSPNGNCYANPALAKNLGSPISATCGNNNPNGRCGDNMCCSKFGYCGATAEYCQDNQGDWRVTPCAGNGGVCYNSNNQAQLNLNGAISRTGLCGSAAPNTRCSDGQCCSRHGYCGSDADYCAQNQGDWRMTTCSANNNISPRDAVYNNQTDDDALGLLTTGSDSAKVILGLLSAAAVAL